EARPGRQIRAAQVEVDVELVARERPAVALARDQRGRAGVHERELRSRVRRSSAAAPRVSDESARGIELALVHDLALVDGPPTALTEPPPFMPAYVPVPLTTFHFPSTKARAAGNGYTRARVCTTSMPSEPCRT